MHRICNIAYENTWRKKMPYHSNLGITEKEVKTYIMYGLNGGKVGRLLGDRRHRRPWSEHIGEQRLKPSRPVITPSDQHLVGPNGSSDAPRNLCFVGKRNDSKKSPAGTEINFTLC